MVDEIGLSDCVRHGGAAHGAGVGKGARRAIAEVTQYKACEHPGAADAGVAVHGNARSLAQARGDIGGKCSKCHRIGEVHVADRVVEIGQTQSRAGVGFVLQPDRGGLGLFQQGDECIDPCLPQREQIIGQDLGA